MVQQPARGAPRLTAEEYLDQAPPGRSELIAGEIVTLSPSGSRHGQIVSRIDRTLGAFVEQHGLGEVMTADAGYVLARNPDTVRGPNVSFISRARIPDGGLSDGFFPGAPDLAIEVVSPNDRWIEVEEKVLLYQTAGAREVWVVEPKHQAVHVYLAGSLARIYQKDQSLVSDLLPGFTLGLRQLFA